MWKEFLNSFNAILTVINDFIYGKFLIILLIAVGLYFTIRTLAAHIFLFPDAFKVLKEKSGKGSISSFQALMIATASRVGTGNIAGVTTAIVTGGAGAVFWMWIMAIIGSASALVESTLAQVYKEKDGTIYKGGPAYYIEKALGMRWLGIIFSVLLILTFAFGFNGLQSHTLASSFKLYFSNFHDGYIPLIIGVLVAAFSAFMFFGSSNIIGKVSSVIVPVMAVLYIGVGIVILFMNLGKLGDVFGMIFKDAFDFKAIFGGFTGSCMVVGIKRGLFSNEAGMGSAPNAAAAAEVSHPVKQGMVQVFSVFIDTIIICSTTAFMVLLAGPLGATDDAGKLIDGIPFVQLALDSQFGHMGIYFITVCIVLFTSSSIIGNYFYAEFNIKFISKNPVFMLCFRIFAVITVFLGAQMDFSTSWAIADILMGGMATVNCIAMVLLGGIAVKVIQDYKEQKVQGLNPVFKAEKLGITNTECWK